MKQLDSKTLIALVVILGCFSLLGIYVLQGRVPDQLVGYIVAGALTGILGFFFGTHNGTLTGQLLASTQLSQALTAQLATISGLPGAVPVKTTVTVEPPPPAPVVSA